jgi:hypothetical protein
MEEQIGNRLDPRLAQISPPLSRQSLHLVDSDGRQISEGVLRTHGREGIGAAGYQLPARGRAVPEAGSW